MCKHHGNGVCIVGYSCNKLTYGNVVKLIMGEALNVNEDVLADRGEYLLTY